ncbi:sorting nexin-13 isoform X3 [Hydra vulgaris]|uniref:Sorting nexin-13 isoform X3 n=1 Tax=Hydra vulgaris TaxID=6087 RepID=A0ABM4CYU3_HYDVU
MVETVKSSRTYDQIVLPSNLLWILLAFFLYIVTFGVIGTLFSVLYVLLFISGFALVIGKWSIKKSKCILSSDDVQLFTFKDNFCGIPFIFEKINKAPYDYKYDKRMTGSSGIDDVIQEILHYFLRDYIHNWYLSITDDERFLYELRQTIQHIVIMFATRSKEVQWVPFLTTRLVDIFATHLRIFRITKERIERKNNATNLSVDETLAQAEIDLEEIFFSVENEVEGISRQAVCLDDEIEQKYLQDVTELLLYLLLPPEQFQDKLVRAFLLEVIATSVFLPTIKMVCDPDYVNQNISWMCNKDTTFTVEAFLTTIRYSTDIDDIEETKKKVDIEIAKLRSQDSHVLESNDSEMSIKQQLSSLMYVRKLCVTTLRRLKNGRAEEAALALEEPDNEFMEMLPSAQNMPKLTLKEILEDNTALSYFIEFMATYNAEHYVFFHLTIEGFRATAIQQLCILAEETTKAHNKKLAVPSSENFEQLRQAAFNIYEEYLSPKASPRILLDDQLVRKIVKDIKSTEPSGAYFDNAHMAVYKILSSQKYYGTFLNSTAYVKCLVDLDLVNKSEDDQSLHNADDRSRTMSVVSNASNHSRIMHDEPPFMQPWTPDNDLRISALIGQANIMNNGSKSYAIYTIHVCRTTSEGSRNWTVIRRYSDFHDFHMQLREKYESLHWLQLPVKKKFGNMDQDFIDKRKYALENYLQPLLDTTLLAENPGLFELVVGFLEQGEYYPGKSAMARKIDHIINPLQNSISSVSKSVKSKADFWIKKNNSITNLDRDTNIGKLSDALDSEVVDNIPLRILLLLMDEVFDLKERNQWLRRRIVSILREIIKATFGDRINRKIVDWLDFATNSPQIAEYLKQFRDAYWPGGVLAEATPERDIDTRRKMRMVTKAKMLGSIPDELRRFLGSEAVREGTSRVFEMFQHSNLNKRLFYVCFEALVEEIFVDNKFGEIFKRIHKKKTTE